MDAAMSVDREASPLPLLVRIMAGVATAFLLLMILSLASYAAYGASFQDRVYPGVSVHGMDLSGLNSSEAALQLAGAFTYPQTGRIAFRYGDKTWVATPKELGLSLDYITSIHTALAVGRSSDDLSNLATLYQSRFSGADISPVLQYDARQALTYLQGIAGEIEQPMIEARLALEGGQVVAEPGQIGHSVDLNTMLALVAVPIGHLTDGDIPVMVHDSTPQVMDASAQADAARSLLSQNFSLSIKEPQQGDPGPWTLTPQTLSEMLLFRHVSDGTLQRYTVSLDPDKLSAYLFSLSGSVTKPSENARFLFNDGQLVLYRPATRGRALDVAQSMEAIQTAASQGQHQASLTLALTEPAVTDNATAEQLGIIGLLPNGMQYTSFAGSPPERIHNIVLAAEKFNGVLVAPGETFSMSKIIGSIGQEEGFADGLVIIGNKIIKGPGGGVCQVSTTLFRAALMTGFPIAERHGHALRVGYYEVGDGPTPLGVGFDATVFLPEVDFKFVNNSSSYLLMQTDVDIAHNRLTWRFFSTPDGRSIQIASSGIKKQTDPPADQWLPDPTIPLHGYSFFYHAQKGADVSIRRVITQNGASTEDYVNTHYLPWPNQCLYNPSTPFPKGTKCPPK
jgi:vancomycin resistance protein YoaR